MKTFCVVGNRIYKNGAKTELKEVIIQKLKRNAVHTIMMDTPKEYSWKTRDIARVFKTIDACNKLIEQVQESEFARLFEEICIKQIELTEENLIKIV